MGRPYVRGGYDKVYMSKIFTFSPDYDYPIVTDEMDADVWVEKVSKMIEELPDDTLISIYDCHI